MPKKVLGKIALQLLNLATLLTSALLMMSRLNIYLAETYENYSLSVFAYTLPYTFMLCIVLIVIILLTRDYRKLVLPVMALLVTWGLARDTWPRPWNSSQPEEDSFKVMTWNVGIQGIFTKELDFYTNPIHKDIIKTIASEKPHIVCLQEFVARDQELDTSIYQIRSVAEQIGLPYYFYSYNPDIDIRRHSHYGKVIFSKYPIVDQQYVNFDSLKYNNNFVYVDVLKGQDTLRVATFHLQSLKLGKARELTTQPETIENSDTLLAYSKDIYETILGSYEKRVKQAKAVVELVNSTTYPLIICGDMNDVPASYTYALLSRDLDDAYLQAGRGMGHTLVSWIPSLRIDYILHSPERLKSSGAQVLRVPHSDHYPVVAQFNL